jgi:hypothetical protein
MMHKYEKLILDHYQLSNMQPMKVFIVIYKMKNGLFFLKNNKIH